LDVRFLAGPLQEGEGEAGFHGGGEEDVDYFDEEDVLRGTC
jgi:hypothetical protein